ncbi:MAG: calcium/sodium antiporter [Parvibaculum sp.]
MDYLFVLVGLVMLLAGGEGILRGSLSIAARFQLSGFFVGVVIVGFGTSLPELMVSVAAALKDQPEIALGNVVGSNIANILLILGVTALIMPIACVGPDIRRDAIAVVVVSAMLAALSFMDDIGILVGAAMLAGLVIYMVRVYLAERAQKGDDAAIIAGVQASHHAPSELWKAMLFCLGGLIFLVTGADFLVDGATALAEGWGVPQAIIGLTLVAVGTSLPELAASLVAAFRRQSGIVIGNVLGSNLFNILGVLGVTVVISPLPFVGRIAETDVWIMGAIALALLLVIMVWRRIGRVVGLVFLGTYTLYVMSLYANELKAVL